MRCLQTVVSTLQCVVVAGAIGAGPIVSEKFVVQHSPNPVKATQNTNKAGATYYLWMFRTQVTNNYEFPIQVKEFGSLLLRNGEWVKSNSSYGSSEFAEWYTPNSPGAEGWVAPGETVFDAQNWNRNSSPMHIRTKWFYLAEDRDGNQYLAEREIELVPFVPDEPPWPSAGDAATVPISFSFPEPAQGDSVYVQVRVRRYRGGGNPLAVYESSQPLVEAAVPVPGLYKVGVYSSGHSPIEFPLVVGEDSDDLEISLNPRPLSEPVTSGHDSAEVQFLKGAEYLAEIYGLEKQRDRLRAEYSAEVKAFEDAHADMEGFTYDWSNWTRGPSEALKEGSSRATRSFAAVLLGDAPAGLDDDDRALLLKMLPPDSFVWTGYPRLIGKVSRIVDNQKEFLEAVSSQHSDRVARATALATLGLMARSEKDVESVTSIHERLISEYADVAEVDFIANKLLVPARLKIGNSVPDFDLLLMDDDTRISSQSLQGQYTLVHFWASWCGPCKSEMGLIDAAYRTYGEDGISIVSISLDRSIEAVNEYQKRKWAMPWMNVFAGLESEIAEAFDVVGIPSLFLIDPNGVIVALGETLRGEELDKTLRLHLKSE